MNGAAFVVVAHTSWRLDFDHAVLRGGHQYGGLALELLGHPADDGLSTMLAKLPNRLGGAARTTSALGATDIQMPAGRYLVVLFGDRRVHVSIPIVGHSLLSAPKATSRHDVAFAEATGRVSFSSQPGALYTGHASVKLPPMRDPIITTTFVLRDADGPHTYDAASCMHRGTGACPETFDPTFGTGNQVTGGGVLTDCRFWDGADGIGANQAGWLQEADYRATTSGARLYTAMIAISGGNR